MQISYTTEPTPGRINEDIVLAGDSWALVLDGATAPAGIASGCIHDVAWLVRQLGVQLAQLLITTDQPLDALLAAAIGATCRAHSETCDLTNPSSPSATAVLVRWRDKRFDYLVLADSPLILDLGGSVQAITDDRTAHLPDYSPLAVAHSRNTPDGFWVASTNPDAAYHAVTGSAPTAAVCRAALLSDGAARLVDRFGLLTWSELIDFLDTAGPSLLIEKTRAAERSETPEEAAGRRGKRHDDATAVLLRQTKP
ncbi:protein phosphatase 2C domain-containing protein [Protofrankia symbiont of Coriaria ruscifolia]|uniref:protein phosphatase 2C domain-containing protein n=1 Tax=Protofrankia symbiont of Coriaria ruscifolia TaxID=1306542 RepID=UPI0010417031|nr:protein phosphatase 2C domain-containing protein [Protofrankia symbiont of Coriaria ruscifolia]